MSTSYWSHATIGIVIETEKLFKKVVVKTFDHNHPSEWKNDPISGKELWKTVNECIVKEFEDYPEEYEHDLISVKSDGYGGDVEHYFIGFSVSSSTDTWSEGYHQDNRWMGKVFRQIPPLETIKAELEKLLSPYGLWDESKFGLYSATSAG